MTMLTSITMGLGALHADDGKTPPATPPDSGKSGSTRGITLDKSGTTNSNRDKNLMPDVSAKINQLSQLIEVNLYETGVTDIYIVDSRNVVVDEITVSSWSSPVIYMSLPERKGQYWIVIDSDYLYAEGLFIL